MPNQLLCSLRVRDASVKLRDLALGQLGPASMAAAPGGDQPTDLGKHEAGVLAEANQGDALRARLLVVPSLAGTPSG